MDLSAYAFCAWQSSILPVFGEGMPNAMGARVVNDGTVLRETDTIFIAIMPPPQLPVFVSIAGRGLTGCASLTLLANPARNRD
ncbi:hypothetical protein [Breoghania sp.]|uniref:hypothetical protein n=1 Tax=Breoghania sp. TaxID=2065378 RepID=UPI002AA8479B|nr:hypothetical protein [Breoghania sp.]